jgi:hypothetical protein
MTTTILPSKLPMSAYDPKRTFSLHLSDGGNADISDIRRTRSNGRFRAAVKNGGL